MTVTEAARRLDLQPITIRKAIERGKLRAVKHGPAWWITPAALDVYRAQSLGKSGRPPRP